MVEVMLGFKVKFENIVVGRFIWENLVFVKLIWRVGWIIIEVLILSDMGVDKWLVVVFVKNFDVKFVFIVVVDDIVNDCVVIKVGCIIFVVYIM